MFVGRKDELERLDALRRKNTSSLVVVTGRRRIGKSRLVNEYAKSFDSFWEFSGLPPEAGIGVAEQQQEFQRQLQTYTGGAPIVSSDWGEIFHHLSLYTKEKDLLILFDELSWMANNDVVFLAKLKTAWDLYFSKNSRLVIVLCSSVSSWIEDNLIKSTGFVGRIALHLRLRELSLASCAAFWRENKVRVSNWEKVKVLSVTGGVPCYLEEVDPKESAEKNINDLCFREGALLFSEFDRLFSELFNRQAKSLKELVELLADGALSYEEISSKLPQLDGGTLSKRLEVLTACGFISRDYTWSLKSGKTSKLSKFRLSDNYLRFYLKFVSPFRKRILAETFPDRSVAALPGWESIMGLQFENLILTNRHRLLELLNISLTDIISDSPFFQTKTKQRPGCQIDYLVHTRFNTLYICEIKFSRNPIGLEVAEEVEKKIARLVVPKNFSLRPALIYAGEVTEELKDSRYFDKLVGLDQFFE